MKSVKTSYTCGLLSQKLCYFCVVLWLYVLSFEHRYLTEMRDHQCQPSKPYGLDRVNTDLRGIQRNMQTQPSRDVMLDMQREIRAVLRNVERMNISMLGRENYKLCIIMQNF